MSPKTKNWLKALGFTFAGGFILIGGLDFFHTAMGVQRYTVNSTTITSANWPFFLPLQMALAGWILLISWTFARKLFLDKALGPEQNKGPVGWPLISISTVLVVLVYVFAVFFQGISLHGTFYFLLAVGSFVYLIFFQSRHHMLTFLTTSLSGVLVESFLVHIGYFEYPQIDLFLAAPGWLITVYGWVGIAVHEFSRLTVGKDNLGLNRK